MRKKICRAALGLACLCLAGCVGQQAPPAAAPTPEATAAPTAAPTPTPAEDPTLVEDPNWDSIPEWEEGDLAENPNPGRVFALTEAERVLYETYLEEMDTKIFRDAAPVSIAKIHIQCGIDGKWAQEYAMYAPEGLTATPEDFAALHSEDVTSTPIESRQEMADYMFANLDGGEFLQEDDRHGRLRFFVETDAFDFYMIKDADGVWRPKYDPFNPVVGS
jgi:hypothetical protein